MTSNSFGRKECKQITFEEKCKIFKVDRVF